MKLIQPVFLCKECHKEIQYNPNVFQDNSINCDVCDMWFHFRFANISDEQKMQMKMIIGFVVTVN